MAYTARASINNDPYQCGVIGMAESNDLYEWQSTKPLFGGLFSQLEVPQIFTVKDRWYCLFCNHPEDWSDEFKKNYNGPTRRGTHYLIADKFEGKKFNSPNDLAVRSNGEIWFTDPSYGLRGRKAEVDGKWVYKLKKDGSVSVVCKTFDMPNGIAFSPDEKRIYIADSGKIGKIRAYDVLEEGLLEEPAFKIDIRCDGMCVDTKGRIYTTAGGGIHVFDANGKKIGLIPVPEHPANVCFGGENYDTLFITARKSLYSIKINAKGQAVKAKK